MEGDLYEDSEEFKELMEIGYNGFMYYEIYRNDEERRQAKLRRTKEYYKENFEKRKSYYTELWVKIRSDPERHARRKEVATKHRNKVRSAGNHWKVQADERERVNAYAVKQRANYATEENEVTPQKPLVESAFQAFPEADFNVCLF